MFLFAMGACSGPLAVGDFVQVISTWGKFARNSTSEELPTTQLEETQRATQPEATQVDGEEMDDVDATLAALLS